MDQETIQEFKRQLEEKKEQLLAQLANVGHKVAGEGNNFEASYPDYGDPASIEDSANEVADYTTNLSFERDLENELRSIEKALRRVAEGQYGVCTYCNQDIEKERLKVRPESTACVSCKKAIKGED
jgi:DnaK suppressor protein